PQSSERRRRKQPMAMRQILTDLGSRRNVKYAGKEMHVSTPVFGKTNSLLLILAVLLVVSLASCGAGGSSTKPPRQAGDEQSTAGSVLLKGKTASLSWIYGRDCLRGMQAYLQSAGADPDAALVGTGWVDPTNGSLILGHNNCVASSPSMDTVIQLVHSRGGMAYLTITMNTEGQ